MTDYQVEAELPGVYLDAVVLDTPAGRLHLFNRVPEPGETDVALGAPVDLSIIDIGAAPGILAASVRIYVSGVLVYSGATGFTAGWSGTVDLPAANTSRFLLEHAAPFLSLSAVPVRVVAASVDGAGTLDATYVFRCADLSAPKLIAAQTVTHRRVRVAFDEAMGATTTLDPARYALAALTVPSVVPLVVGVEPELGTTFVLTLDRDMTPGARYLLTVSGVEDVKGNPIEAHDHVELWGYACAAPEGRRFDLFALLPKVNRRADEVGTGDLARFLACLQEVTDLLLCDVDRWGDILDPDFAPEWFVDRMLEDLGNPFTFDLTLEDKRRLLRVLVPLYKQKGTATGIQNAARFFLGLEVAVVPYAGEGLVLGESALGEDWVLSVAAPRSRRSFDVTVTRGLSDAERSRLRAIVQYMKLVSTHLVNILEPAPAVVIDDIELGLSALGDTWSLH